VLPHMMAGSKEDAETVTAFFEDMKRRGLNDPLLVTSDGAPGIIKAIEVCFPRAARQRCLAHRMRNLAAKLPEDVWPEFKVRAQGPIRHQAGPLRASSPPASLPTMAASTTVRSPASWTTSKPASRTYDSRSPIAGRSARRISLSDCSSVTDLAPCSSPASRRSFERRILLPLQDGGRTLSIN
jgi:hypothetical protein